VKRYVTNAIALGPAGEERARYGDETEMDPIMRREDEPSDMIVDAHFEVIRNKGKEPGKREGGTRKDPAFKREQGR
ncbi:MAG: hypothetical protein IJN00_06965, partial [Clostridia bacterium]|nr:hypothetical protein [Clostridia bacterium]